MLKISWPQGRSRGKGKRHGGFLGQQGEAERGREKEKESTYLAGRAVGRELGGANMAAPMEVVNGLR